MFNNNISSNSSDNFDYNIYTDKNGKIVWEGWYKNNNLHREDDLPAFKYFEEEGNLKLISWYLNGKNHREGDLPSSISYYPNGNIKKKIWSKDGLNHRENDKPAVIEFDNNGDILSETWFLKGKIHRETDQPAFIEYFANNGIDIFVKSHLWYKNDLKYREGNKPTIIYYYPNGIKRMEEFNSSVVFYYMNGKTKSQIYYLNKNIHRFGFVFNDRKIFEIHPAIIKFNLDDNIQKFYMIYNKELSLEKYLRYLYLFRRTIYRYKCKKRDEIKTFCKECKLNLKNGKDIINLVSLFVY